MSKIKAKPGAVFDRINNVFIIISVMLLVFALVAVCADITVRYATPQPLMWVQEVTNYALVYITFLGSAWVLKKNLHVRVDLFLSRLRPRGRALLDAIDSILGAIVCLTIVVAGSYVTWDYIVRSVPSVELLHAPMYLVVGVIPFGSLFLFIQCLRSTHESLSQFRASQIKKAN